MSGGEWGLGDGTTGVVVGVVEGVVFWGVRDRRGVVEVWETGDVTGYGTEGDVTGYQTQVSLLLIFIFHFSLFGRAQTHSDAVTHAAAFLVCPPAHSPASRSGREVARKRTTDE